MHLHFDLVAGIAGDMAVAALVDLGVPMAVVQEAIDALALEGVEIALRDVDAGMATTARKFDVIIDGQVDAPHDHTHGHDHSHDHGHEHEHAHEHSHEHAHQHDHSHEHEHAHEHDHGHEHEHSHAHEHNHDHDHEHEHAHEHSHEHEHDHAHEHEHSHEHDHGHEHAHEHGHNHGHSHEHGGQGSWAAIKAMLHAAELRPRVRQVALDIFEHIAHAEARVHGMKVEEVTFHEVGAFDSIVDIVAVAACVDHLGVTRVTSSPVPVGRGFTWSQHGRIPVPAPATLFILKGAEVVSSGLDKELVTPTGAGILAALVEEYIDMPAFVPTDIGLGAGTRRLPDRPNIVRAVIGKARKQKAGAELELSADVVIEANIDDMTGELCAHVTDALMAQGALDVWWTPILMKKGRPAHQLSVLCTPQTLQDTILTILTETTTLGVRQRQVTRHKCLRRWEEVSTPYGAVKVKLGMVGERVVNVAPEFDSVRQVAKDAGVPVKEVWRAAVAHAPGDGVQ